MIEADKISREFEDKLKTATSFDGLESLRLYFLGRKQGILTLAMKELSGMSLEQKRESGPKLQEIKKYIESELESRSKKVAEQSANKKEAKNKSSAVIQDREMLGHLHPITQTISDMNAFFRSMGFSVYDGPELETDEFNFQRLNVPKDHVARDMQDTIYIDAPNILLRTQASSIEARALKSLKPPFRVVAPGRVYRNEKANKSNHFVFHHYQGVVVDRNITMADLFGTLQLLFEHLYGRDVVLRFRSKYYPEVEPGVGPDMRCFNCKGKGCVVCKGRGWIEMAGAGIIHPKVMKMAGIDTKKFTGFAFGLGLDRWVMAKYNITDIRTLLGGRVVYPYFEREKLN